MSDLHSLASRIPYGRGPALLAMAEKGEATLGLKLLIENLYEFEVRITEDERYVLRDMATRAGVEKRVIDWIDLI